jgi:pimeloyl-ACP methyl ester carboxylesterase
VRVERADPRAVHQSITRNVISTGDISAPTKNVLQRWFLTERFEKQPEKALRALHDLGVQGYTGPDELFAAAELSFLHGERSGNRAYFLASAVYAYAFLFPEESDKLPDRFDPRLRVAADIYNRAITEGFASKDGSAVELRSGTYRLPFGQLAVTFDTDQLLWGQRRLTAFTSVAELKVYGFANRYRWPGIGAPLVSSTAPFDPERGFEDFVAPKLKVPVTAVLRIENPWQQLRASRVSTTLELYTITDAETITINGRKVPLEMEPTSALGYSLAKSGVSRRGLEGFLKGDLVTQELPRQLASISPYRPERIPVVFVHGTVSTPATWASMVNDLLNDPRIRERFHFWFFVYDTGNPIAYSAALLREALQDAVRELDPEGLDQCLNEMVVIGHSQGGLLTKMTAIDSGTRFWDAVSDRPLEELALRDETRKLLERALFVEPLPFVQRLIFISTPHRGSYVAGRRLSHLGARLVQLPASVVDSTGDLFAGYGDELAVKRVATSVDNMTPGHPFIVTLASIPVAPGVATHSIIPVRDDGPIESGDDGVVKYSAAHLDDADSELVLRSGHSCQSHPQAVEEVRRILLLHSAEQQRCPGNLDGRVRAPG